MVEAAGAGADVRKADPRMRIAGRSRTTRAEGERDAVITTATGVPKRSSRVKPIPRLRDSSTAGTTSAIRRFARSCGVRD